MHTLKQWSARRAGAAITIIGTNTFDNSPAKITGITVIEPRRGGLVVATGKDGTEYSLVE